MAVFHQDKEGENTVSEYNQTEEYADLAIEQEEINEETRLTPFNPSDIDIRDQKLTIDSLVKRLKNNRIDLYPDYQRLPDLWDVGKQSRLIESILIKIPLPAFFFDGSTEVWQVVDGLQRLSSIKNFVIGNDTGEKLKLKDLEYLKEWNAKGFDDLPLYLKERLEETNITAYIINPGTPDDVKYNIFRRINTGGLTLSPQEIRNAVNRGISAKFTKDLANLEEFKQATCYKIPQKRMEDLEFVTRFIAFYLRGDIYKPDLNTFLNDGLSDLKGLKQEEREVLKNKFKKAMQLSIDIFGNDAFRKRYNKNDRRKQLNKALFDTWSVNLAKLTEEEQKILLRRKGRLKNKFVELMNVQAFDNAVGSGDSSAIAFRFNATKDLIHNVIYDN